MPSFSTSSAVLTIALILVFASPAHAFGAGNIASVAKIEGLNCKLPPFGLAVQSSKHLLTIPSLGRHGDIEDTLLTLVMSRAAGGKKFDKMNVARVYFGNWLRDYCELPLGCGCARTYHSEPRVTASGPPKSRPARTLANTYLPSSTSNRCRYRQICLRRSHPYFTMGSWIHDFWLWHEGIRSHN